MQGAAFDLPLAIGILAANEKIKPGLLESFVIMGELSLDGSLQPVKGVLPIALQARKEKFKGIILPMMNAQEAGDAPRFRHLGSSKPEGGRMIDGGEVWLESGISSEVIRELLSRGHKIVKNRGSFGGYQGIWIDTKRGVLFGGSESRSDGAAIGY